MTKLRGSCWAETHSSSGLEGGDSLETSTWLGNVHGRASRTHALNCRPWPLVRSETIHSTSTSSPRRFTPNPTSTDTARRPARSRLAPGSAMPSSRRSVSTSPPDATWTALSTRLPSRQSSSTTLSGSFLRSPQPLSRTISPTRSAPCMRIMVTTRWHRLAGATSQTSSESPPTSPSTRGDLL